MCINMQIPPSASESLQLCSKMLGVPQQTALIAAINRLRYELMYELEGDLADVNYSQSLPPETPSGQVTSLSLPGFERA